MNPAHFAKLLGISEKELAGALHVRPRAFHVRPDDPSIQAKLGEFAAVFERLQRLKPDVMTAAFHFKNTPIAELGYRTLFEAVRDHDSERALQCLESISNR